MSRPTKTGHLVEPVEGEELEQLKENYDGYCFNPIRLQPGGWFFLGMHNLRLLDDIYDFKFHSDGMTDVIIMTYPKCGTTWAQEIVWTLRNNPGLDHPRARDHLFIRSPFIEADMYENEVPTEEDPFVKALQSLSPDRNPADGVNLQLAEVTPKPRTIKTHFPFSLMPVNLLDKCKVIYVARNPFDACVSYCHHNRLDNTMGFVGSLEKFVDYFVRGDVTYGSYMEHFKEAWERRGHKNLLFLFFEDMKKDLLGELRKIDAFLETGLSDETLSKIAEYTSFGSMKEREVLGSETDSWVNREVKNKEGGFFRKGKTGDWKKKLTPSDEAKIRSWMEAALEGTGYQFQEDMRK